MNLEDRNYYGDRRVRAGMKSKWYESLDESKMQATLLLCYEEEGTGGVEESVTVPFRFEVCSICDGKGTHVNPSIDASGLTAEDFADDPDFAEDYCNGVYNVTCYGCGGKRVEAVMDRDRCDPALLQRIDAEEEERNDFRLMQESERRMGA